MPSNHKQKNGAAATATAAAQEGEDNIKQTVSNAAEHVDDAAQATGAKAEEAKQKATGAYNSVQQSAQPYVEQAKRAAQPYVEQAKQAAQPYVEQTKQKAGQYMEQAKERASPYVDQAKEKASPYVEQAKHAVEVSKEKVQAMRRGVDGKAEQVNSFDITKTTFFATVVVLVASIIAAVWRVIESVKPIGAVAVAIRDKCESSGLSGKVWEMYYYSTVALEHIPVVGYRIAEVIRIYVEQVADEARKQIRHQQLGASKKVN